MAIAPGNAAVYNRLGAVYMALENFDAAIEAFGKVVALEPGYQKALDSLNAAIEQKKAMDKEFVLP